MVALQPLAAELPSVNIVLHLGSSHAGEAKEPDRAGGSDAFLAAVCLNAMQHVYALSKARTSE